MKRIQSALKLKLIVLASLALVLCNGLILGAAHADSKGSLAQTYSAASTVLPGMFVETKTGQPNTVQTLSKADIRSLIGVVVPANQATIVLSGPAAASQVLVASSGLHAVLVSNQAGVIKAGDYLVVSSLNGIAMKAAASDPYIVGQAEGGFDGVHAVVSNAGQYNIGSLAANIGLTANPLYHNYKFLPSFITKAANGLANKQVSLSRLLLSLIVSLATIVMVANILIGGVRGGMISIGRNPLSKVQITRGLIRVILVGFMVLIVGLVLAYLLLVA